MTRTAASLMIVALLAGCSTLPRDGPSGRNVVGSAASPERAGDYALVRSEEHTSELQSRENLVCRLLLETHAQRALHSFPTRRSSDLRRPASKQLIKLQ